MYVTFKPTVVGVCVFIKHYIYAYITLINKTVYEKIMFKMSKCFLWVSAQVKYGLCLRGEGRYEPVTQCWTTYSIVSTLS